MSNSLTGIFEHQLSAYAQHELMNASIQQNALCMKQGERVVDERELKLFDQYNWGSKITNLDRLYREVEELHAHIRHIESKIAKARDNIPEQVLNMYDQQRTVEALAK